MTTGHLFTMSISLFVKNFCIHIYAIPYKHWDTFHYQSIYHYFFFQDKFCLDLLEAAESGSTGLVKKLLDAGVNIEEKNYKGGQECRPSFFL